MGISNYQSEKVSAAEHPGTEISGKLSIQSNIVDDTANTYKRSITPLACWKIEDICFDFNSVFIREDAKQAFERLRELHKYLTQKLVHILGKPPVMSVFGHADPVGLDIPNKKLSMRRAAAVYGILKKDARIWKELYVKSTDIKNLQEKIKDAGFYKGLITGNMDQETEAAILDYMNEICPDYKLTDKDFIGGEDNAYQGCGEFNPVLMFSKEEWELYRRQQDKTQRDIINQPNRRVIIFFFKPGIKAAADIWPCIKAADIQNCKTQFFPDVKKRRDFQPGLRRYYKVTGDTFSCKFYEQLARLSPCEEIRAEEKQTWQIKLVGFEDNYLSHPRDSFSRSLGFHFEFLIELELEKIKGNWICLSSIIRDVKSYVKPNYLSRFVEIVKIKYTNLKKVLSLKNKTIQAEIKPNYNQQYSAALSSNISRYFDKKDALYIKLNWNKIDIIPEAWVLGKMMPPYNKTSIEKVYDDIHDKWQWETTDYSGVSQNWFYADEFFTRINDFDNRLPFAKGNVELKIRHSNMKAGEFWITYRYDLNRIK